MGGEIHGPVDGWIPTCPCDRCADLAAGATRGASPRLAPERARWVDDTISLLALAVALEQLTGRGPEVGDGFTDEMAAWFDRYGRATEILAEVANHDAPLLRSLAGPPCDDEEPPPPGRELLLAAAIHVERR